MDNTVDNSVDNTKDNLANNGFVSRVPWSLEPSLKEKTDELGIDFDRFIEGLKNDTSVNEMAEKFQVSPETLSALKEHFIRLGIQSIVGQD